MKTLLVVDVQNDFCPGGSLAIPQGDKVVPVINDLMNKFSLVIASKDLGEVYRVGKKRGRSRQRNLCLHIY